VNLAVVSLINSPSEKLNRCVIYYTVLSTILLKNDQTRVWIDLIQGEWTFHI